MIIVKHDLISLWNFISRRRLSNVAENATVVCCDRRPFPSERALCEVRKMNRG